jgi:hypothetical protein
MDKVYVTMAPDRLTKKNYRRGRGGKAELNLNDEGNYVDKDLTPKLHNT